MIHTIKELDTYCRYYAKRIVVSRGVLKGVLRE